MALQCASPAADHRELDGRDPRALREHVYFSAEDRRRASVGLVRRGSVSDVFAGDSSLLAKVLGRLQSVEASLASLTNSSDGERAAEDVEERLQVIEPSSQPLMRVGVRRRCLPGVWTAREPGWSCSLQLLQ